MANQFPLFNESLPRPVIAEEEIPLGEEELQNLNADNHLTIFCKIISEKQFSPSLVQTVMSGTWGINDGFSVQSGPEGTFQITFNDDFDLFRVTRGAPWRFRNHLFLVKAWEPNYIYSPSDYQFANFWVQIWGLSYSYSTVQVGRKIGQYIGEVLETSIYNISEQPGILVKCYVRIDLSRPLQKGKTIVLTANQRIWVDFRYEKLPLLCFYCGILGHEEASCRYRYNDEITNSITPPQYDFSIRGLPTGRKNWALTEKKSVAALHNNRTVIPQLNINPRTATAEQVIINNDLRPNQGYTRQTNTTLHSDQSNMAQNISGGIEKPLGANSGEHTSGTAKQNRDKSPTLGDVISKKARKPTMNPGSSSANAVLDGSIGKKQLK